MNVLYYVNEFPKISESFVINEIYELHNRGHNVAVFALRKGDEEVTHEEHQHIELPVYYVDFSYRDIMNIFPKISPHSYDILKSTLTIFPPKIVGANILIGNHLIDYLSTLSFDVDIIHGHFANNVKIAQVYAAKHHNVPSTVTAHAYEIFSALNPTQIRYICENVNHVFVPSNYNKEYLQGKIGVQNTFTKVPATTEISKFEKKTETVRDRILTIGRLEEKKGYTYGIDAVAQLIKQGYDVKYHIIGTGSQEQLLRNRVQKRGIEGQVNFLGNVSDDRLKVELSKASIFLLPCVIASDGDRDAMPVVLKEAMASETACISTTVSAIPELITDGYDGLLVQPNNTGELFAALKELLDNKKYRDQLAQSGEQTVREGFDISRSVDTLEKELVNII